MELPIFDMAALDRGDRIGALREACLGVGFFYIVGHGLAGEVVDGAVEQARRFFALPVERRMAVSLAHSLCNRGYEPMQSQRLEAGAPPDLKEGYYIGNEVSPGQARFFNEGPNQWPDALPGFRPAMAAYFGAMEALAIRVMRAMAASLDLPRDFFDAFCTDPTSLLRLLHYPPQPPNPQPGEKGCGAHTDWGCLTLLWQDSVGGLQVRMGEDGWI